jgi:hypothetical protein
MVKINRTLNQADCHRQARDYQKPFTQKLTVAHNIPK